jgi:hypothetical protein
MVRLNELTGLTVDCGLDIRFKTFEPYLYAQLLNCGL